jgi:hypothetical protein
MSLMNFSRNQGLLHHLHGRHGEKQRDEAIQGCGLHITVWIAVRQAALAMTCGMWVPSV